MLQFGGGLVSGKNSAAVLVLVAEKEPISLCFPDETRRGGRKALVPLPLRSGVKRRVPRFPDHADPPLKAQLWRSPRGSSSRGGGEEEEEEEEPQVKIMIFLMGCKSTNEKKFLFLRHLIGIKKYLYAGNALYD